MQGDAHLPGLRPAGSTGLRGREPGAENRGCEGGSPVQTCHSPAAPAAPPGRWTPAPPPRQAAPCRERKGCSEGLRGDGRRRGESRGAPLPALLLLLLAARRHFRAGPEREAAVAGRGAAMEGYRVLGAVGGGSFGTVYKARRRHSAQVRGCRPLNNTLWGFGGGLRGVGGVRGRGTLPPPSPNAARCVAGGGHEVHPQGGALPPGAEEPEARDGGDEGPAAPQHRADARQLRDRAGGEAACAGLALAAWREGCHLLPRTAWWHLPGSFQPPCPILTPLLECHAPTTSLSLPQLITPGSSALRAAPMSPGPPGEGCVSTDPIPSPLWLPLAGHEANRAPQARRGRARCPHAALPPGGGGD